MGPFSHTTYYLIDLKHTYICYQQIFYNFSFSIFIRQLDTNQDGFLDIPELHNHLRNHKCKNLPEILVSRVLKTPDEEIVFLNFEEFYTLSQRQEWFPVSRFVTRYCEMVVPSPGRNDATGNVYYLIRILLFMQEDLIYQVGCIFKLIIIFFFYRFITQVTAIVHSLEFRLNRWNRLARTVGFS